MDTVEMWNRRPDWELKNMVKALSMLSWLNTPEQWERKRIAESILRERRKSARIRAKEKAKK